MSNRTFGNKRKGGLSHNWGAFGGYRGSAGVGYQGSYDGPRKRANPLALVLSQEEARRWHQSRKPRFDPDSQEVTLFDQCMPITGKGKRHQPIGDLPKWQPRIITTPQRAELGVLVAAYRAKQWAAHLANLGVQL